jgi:MoaA/NifB/PqqE/SkfB family radical SAM enzyme
MLIDAEHQVYEDYWTETDVISGLAYESVLRHRGASRPIYLRIETVNTCNNNCIICAYRDQTRAKAIMPMPLFRKAVQDYAEMGGGFLSLTPLVGDIFLDRYLSERLEFLRSVPEIRSLGVTTNGAMAHRFDDTELAAILQSFDRLSLSIYGTDPDEYLAMTGKPTYRRMLDGIRRVLELSPNRVLLEFRLLNKKAREELEEWVLRDVRPASGSRPASDMFFINSVITDYANWGIYDAANTPLPGDARWFDSPKSAERPQCLIPLFACIVFSNGNVSFCPCDNFDDTEELRLGNIREHRLIDLYNSPLVRRLWNWRSCGTPEFCKSCSFHIGLDVLRSDPTILTDPHKIVGAG